MALHVGSSIVGTNFKYLDEGAYGTIYVDREAKRIRKLYRRIGKPENHAREVFESEWEALRIAMSDAELGKFVISPVSRISGYQVTDEHGKDITADFLDDAGFEGAFVVGHFQKIGTLGTIGTDIIAAFRQSGIRNIIDASVAIDGNGQYKVIDFSKRDIELEW